MDTFHTNFLKSSYNWEKKLRCMHGNIQYANIM